MQKEIEENTRKIKEQQERMMNFVAKKTVGVPKSSVPAQNVEMGIPLASYAEVVKGYSSYLIHKVSPNETLERLSIIYNVPKDAIRKANGFTGDEIFMKKELIIPDC